MPATRLFPSAAEIGSSVRYEASFKASDDATELDAPRFDSLRVCNAVERKGICISTVQPPSKRATRESQTIFQSEVHAAALGHPR